MSEINETISSVSGVPIVVSGEGVTLQDDTQTLDNVSTVTSGTLVSSSGDGADTDIINNIYNDVHILLVLAILTFAMSCMRAWRKNSLRGC